MGTATGKRRATVKDDGGMARVRKIFRDAEEQALAAMEGAGMATDPDDDEGDGSGPGGHVHVHIHGGESTGKEMASGALPPPAAKQMNGDPNPEGMVNDEGGGANPLEARVAAIEQSISALTEAVNKLAGGGTTAPAATTGDDGDPTTTGTGEITNPAPEDLGADDAMPEELLAAKKSKTGDSVALETSFRAVLADAEVLVPGFRIPTFDAKMPRKKTLDSMCALRRSVMGHLSVTADGADLLKQVAGKPVGDLSKSTCFEVAQLFRAAAGARRAVNNSAGTRDAQRIPEAFNKARPAGKAITSIAELNALHQRIHANTGKS